MTAPASTDDAMAPASPTSVADPDEVDWGGDQNPLPAAAMQNMTLDDPAEAAAPLPGSTMEAWSVDTAPGSLPADPQATPYSVPVPGSPLPPPVLGLVAPSLPTAQPRFVPIPGLLPTAPLEAADAAPMVPAVRVGALPQVSPPPQATAGPGPDPSQALAPPPAAPTVVMPAPEFGPCLPPATGPVTLGVTQGPAPASPAPPAPASPWPAQQVPILPVPHAGGALLNTLISHMLRRQSRRDGLSIIRWGLSQQAAAYQQQGRAANPAAQQIFNIFGHWLTAANAPLDAAADQPDALGDFCLRAIARADPAAS